MNKASTSRVHHTAKTTERGLGWKWQMFRRRILKRDLYLCQPCRKAGRTTPATEVDHIIPRAKGGQMTDDNAQSICAACHEAKTAADEGYTPRPRFGADGRVVW